MNQTRLLTPEQIKQYHEHGYVFLGRILEDKDVDDVVAAESKFRARHMEGEGKRDKAFKTLFFGDLVHVCEPVRRVSTEGGHIPIMCQLLGPNVALTYTQMVTKLPDKEVATGEFPWHQDNGYGTLEPMTDVTVWVALHDVNEENGCVWVIPDSHKQGLVSHERDPVSTFRKTEKQSGGIPAILKKGEAVAFTGLTMHCSKLNHSDKPRLGLFMRYCEPIARFKKDNRSVLDDGQGWMVAGEAPV